MEVKLLPENVSLKLGTDEHPSNTLSPTDNRLTSPENISPNPVVADEQPSNVPDSIAVILLPHSD